MSAIDIPKEIRWISRLLWVDILIRLIIVSILISISALGTEEKLIRFLMIIPKTTLWVLALLGINYYLLKGKKWLMKFLLILVATVIASNIFAFLEPLTVENQMMYSIRTLLGILIIYFLIKQKSFFDKSSLS
ncbi:MAG: hypothetical protein Q8N01_03530 [Sulfuricurvum sp.]|nr:hypothetical protein [Sulfuricurvum sp.]MDP3023370.1 hypothetical protein [Sulfuricurvum sp.]MDP3119475.1 hypothetical protein [Sulfuricurvum sp.]